jgi:hypothetical protein
VAIRYVIVTSHESTYSDPIQFSKGDILVLGKRDTEYSGWIWVTTPDQKEGWAPESQIKRISSNSGTALAEYTARELDTKIGDLVMCTHELHGWLWIEKDNGESGWVPKETVAAT